ncbi:MAG: anti-sigma factor [Gemmatimonadota bacterium]
MTHDELREQAAAYALGALAPWERADVEGHVEACTACRAELDALCEVASLLALSAPAVDPARVSALRSRIMADATGGRPILRASAGAVPLPPKRSMWTEATPWLAAASLFFAVVAGAGWIEARSEGAQVALALKQTAVTLAARDSMLSAFLGPMVHVVSLSEGENQAPRARVFWNHTRKEFIVTAFNVPPAPGGKTYQLWAIRTGKPPISMGTFDTDASGRALAIVPVGDIAEAGFIDNCAVTLEPAGGSPQPTEAPRLMGAWRHVD